LGFKTNCISRAKNVNQSEKHGQKSTLLEVVNEIGKWKIETGHWKLEIGKQKLESKAASFQFPVSNVQFPIRARCKLLWPFLIRKSR